jgi:hypothetical protein
MSGGRFSRDKGARAERARRIGYRVKDLEAWLDERSPSSIDGYRGRSEEARNAG